MMVMAHRENPLGSISVIADLAWILSCKVEKVESFTDFVDCGVTIELLFIYNCTHFYSLQLKKFIRFVM